MKRRNLILLIILIVLLVAAIIVFFTRYHIVSYESYGETHYRIERIKGTLKVLRDFAVNDTASINKIFLADKQNNTILLERKNDHWTVNGDNIARRDFVDVLLETIKDVEVAAPVPKSKLDYVLRSISTNSTKVEIYQDNTLVKTYYVGGVTPDNKGTYMILEGSSAPFEMHIPGFTGFLSTRYITDLFEWKDRILFKYSASDIKSVSLVFPADPENSFMAVNNGNNSYSLISLETGKPITEADPMMIKEFISRYKFVGFESFLNGTTEYQKLDSILKSPEMCIYTVEDRSGTKKTLKTFSRPNFKNVYDDEGNFYNNDVDRFYGVINNDKDLVLLQYINFDLLTKKLSDFRGANP